VAAESWPWLPDGDVVEEGIAELDPWDEDDPEETDGKLLEELLELDEVDGNELEELLELDEVDGNELEELLELDEGDGIELEELLEELLGEGKLGDELLEELLEELLGEGKLEDELDEELELDEDGMLGMPELDDCCDDSQAVNVTNTPMANKVFLNVNGFISPEPSSGK